MPNETILLKRFGRQLSMFRKQKMISREELGNRVRLSAGDIRDMEAGKMDPCLSTIFLIARALDVYAGDLLMPAGGSDSQYYVYRFCLLKLIDNLSMSDLKKTIDYLAPARQ